MQKTAYSDSSGVNKIPVGQEDKKPRRKTKIELGEREEKLEPGGQTGIHKDKLQTISLTPYDFGDTSDLEWK